MTEKASQPGHWPDLAGRLQGDGHVLQVRVYYEDTDFAGIVYHANYLRYFERARSDYLRLLGIDQMALHGDVAGETLVFAVRAMAIEFIKPARMDDVLMIETTLGNLGGARLVLNQSVSCDNERLCTADVDIALINGAGKPRRLPEGVRKAFGAAP